MIKIILLVYTAFGNGEWVHLNFEETQKLTALGQRSEQEVSGR